jgi:TPR repeat protein
MQRMWRGLTAVAAMLLLAVPAQADPSVIALGGAAMGDAPATPEAWLAACGDLTGSPYEMGREGRGVADDKALLLEEAETVCAEAVRQAPDSVEAGTWLGRVYLSLGRGSDAQPLLERANESGSAFGLFLLSQLMLNGYRYGIEGDYDRGLSLIQQAGDSGFAPAEAALADEYERGEKLTQDYQAAYRYYGLAADKRLPFALFKVGYNYHVGVTTDVDYEKALDNYSAAADLGSPEGANGLAQLYEFGLGVERDDAKAVDLHTRAAALGSAASEAELGYFYSTGTGVEKDPAKALDWFTKASDHGNGYGKAQLALYYLFNAGENIDLAKGYALAQEAQLQGIVLGESILGFLYATGLGTERDLWSAGFHFGEAANKGDDFSQKWLPVIEAEKACADEAGSQYEPGLFELGQDVEQVKAETAVPACENALTLNPNSPGDKAWLARAYLAAGDSARANPLLLAAAAAGNPLAQSYVVGYSATIGDAALQEKTVSALLASSAAENFAPAQLAIGEAYERGIGVPADLNEAIAWYRKAAEYPMPQAAERYNALVNTDGDGTATAETGFAREPLAPF